jgi:hypothetical protein
VAITLVGVGTFAETQSSTSITPALPSGVQAGDLILLLLAAGEDSPEPIVNSSASGYALRGSKLTCDYGAGGMTQWVYWKIAGSSESDPTFQLNGGDSNGGGIWAATCVWRGVDNADPFALDTPSQGQTYPTPGTSTTFTPPDVTTDHAGATIVSFVTTSDNNELALGTANGYTLGFGGANYDSTLGSDGSLGMAYKINVGAAGTYSLPTWSQGANGADYWSYLTTALKDGAAATSANAGVATGTASAEPDTAKVEARGTGAATATAEALNASGKVSRDALAGVAEGTASASPDTAKVQPNATGFAAATGTTLAGAASVSAWSGYAAATGLGLDATAQTTAGTIIFNAQVAEGTLAAIAARGSLAASLGFAAGRSS